LNNVFVLKEYIESAHRADLALAIYSTNCLNPNRKISNNKSCKYNVLPSSIVRTWLVIYSALSIRKCTALAISSGFPCCLRMVFDSISLLLSSLTSSGYNIAPWAIALTQIFGPSSLASAMVSMFRPVFAVLYIEWFFRRC